MTLDEDIKRQFEGYKDQRTKGQKVADAFAQGVGDAISYSSKKTEKKKSSNNYVPPRSEPENVSKETYQEDTYSNDDAQTPESEVISDQKKGFLSRMSNYFKETFGVDVDESLGKIADVLDEEVLKQEPSEVLMTIANVVAPDHKYGSNTIRVLKKAAILAANSYTKKK